METTLILEKEFEYFKNHLPVFIKEHPDKYVVIVGEEVIGFYDSIAIALSETVKEHKPGTFFVELCTPDKSYYNVALINWNVA